MQTQRPAFARFSWRAHNIMEFLKVYLDADGNWVLPLAIDYDCELADAIGHEDALADACNSMAEQLSDLADTLRAGMAAVDVDEHAPDSADDYS